MYVLAFAPYDPKSKVEDRPAQARAFSFIRAAFKQRRFDQSCQMFVPLIGLQNDPERADAFRELNRCLRADEVRQRDEWILKPEGTEWAVADGTYDLIREGVRELRVLVAGADDLDDFDAVDTFLTATKDGPTRKLTQDERDKEIAARKEAKLRLAAAAHPPQDAGPLPEGESP